TMKQYFSNFRIFGITINSLIFYLIILLLPTQFGKHFWPDFSYILGLRIDYLSPTFYVTDILIGLLFTSWLFSAIGRKLSGQKTIDLKLGIGKYWKLIFFLLFLAIGILLSKSPLAGVYGFVKLLEYLFLFFYITFEVKNFFIIVQLLSLGIIFEGLLAILQYVNHGSIGSLLYFFGERSFNSQTPGIANASLNGEMFLRPYGTFSHPNVLAGYLTIALAMVISNFQFQISNFKKILFSFSIIIGTIGIILTMSRVAIILWLIILSWYLLKKSRKFLGRAKFPIGLLVVLIFIGSIGIVILLSPLRFRFLEINPSDQAFVVRKDLIVSSVLMFKDNFFFGVGINNFLVNLPYFQKPNISSLYEYLQPVHNIYFLILAQTGLVGFIYFLYFIAKTMKQTLKKGFSISNFQFSIFSAILILGLFDHYFLTLQQGQLLLLLVIAYCWANSLSNRPLKY
ncbi:MAG: O-antigen ligase family protein, partial [bacterium]|nr:O-antigen ligase family protein [bacterium]